MLGSTIPGLTADVMQAEAAASLRAAQDRLTVAAMVRDQPRGRLMARHAQISTRFAALRRHFFHGAGQAAPPPAGLVR
jgi:hypothetical protein